MNVGADGERETSREIKDRTDRDRIRAAVKEQRETTERIRDGDKRGSPSRGIRPPSTRQQRGLFSGGQKAPSSVVSPDKQYINKIMGDTAAFRKAYGSPVTGMDIAGKAEQQYVRGLFNQSRDDLANQQMSSQTSAIGQAGRFGGYDAGMIERIGVASGRDRLMANQKLNAAQDTELAKSYAGNLAGQQDRRYNALSALPQISQGNYSTIADVGFRREELANQRYAVNAANKQADKSAMSGIFGTAGLIAGSSMGPIGGAVGYGAGSILGRIF